MKKLLLMACLLLAYTNVFCWGFWAHQRINHYAVFLLPPEMMVLYKPNIDFITEHAVDPDKRRYAVAEEAPRHFIDIDVYGTYPFDSLPRSWKDAVARYGEDSVQANGIVPWHVQVMLNRLTRAFEEKNYAAIMKNSADIGHYIADACVPLHASSNHNGQLTNQKGIHAFWESRVPELLADQDWDFMLGRAQYIKNPGQYIWERVLESARKSDTVLAVERRLTAAVKEDEKFSFEERNGVVIRQYSSTFTRAFDKELKGMVEDRMRTAVYSVASFWYTAWINAGQPDLKELAHRKFTEQDLKEFDKLNTEWRNAGRMIGRQEE